MIGSISGQIKAKAARLDPSSYGRSDTWAVGRWFWEIDKVLLLLIAMLIGIGLIAVAAASPAAGQRYSGGSVRFSELHYFYRQIAWIALGIGQLQPSEFLKPFFVVAMAWLLSLREQDKSLPIFWISAGVTGVVA